MKGSHYLTKTSQFDLVYEQGQTWTNRQLVLKVIPNQTEKTRCGFSISRKVGGAVVRNLVKRRLREIIRAAELKPGWDIVLVARHAAGQMSFQSLEAAVFNVLRRSGITA